MNTRSKGFRAEEHAREFLERKGYTFLQANSYQRGGEIDLIMRDGDYIVFVEVKSVGKSSQYSIFETISKKKRRRLKRAIDAWIHKSRNYTAIWRLDFVGVVVHNKNIVHTEHQEFMSL